MSSPRRSLRILLAAMGSDGDVVPFLALGQRMLGAGHSVLLASSQNHEARALALGVPFAAVSRAWATVELRALSTRVLSVSNPLAQLAIILQESAASQIESIAGLRTLLRDVDVIVYPPIFVAAAAVARASGVRHVSAHFAPLHRAVRYGPTGHNAGALVNRLMWSVASRVVRARTDTALNAIVTAAGLPPWRDILFDAAHSKQLDLIAVSPRVLPPDPAYPPQTQTTGYWFADMAAAAPDPTLASFIAERKPVVIGFGSMMPLDPAATTHTILQGVAHLDGPVLIMAGWGGLGQTELPKNVRVCPFVSHEWLFERAACVVHHGGAGTTAAALRAGIPQSVVPHLGDQPVWGARVRDLGIGVSPCPYRKFNAKWLRGAVDRMLVDDAMKSRAKSLGREIRAEDGTGAALSAIERLARDEP